MREALIEILRKLHKADWVGVTMWESGVTHYSKEIRFDEDFIHYLQELIEEPIFEESETTAEGMEKLREMYGEGVL